MPWKTANEMEQRVEFVLRAKDDLVSFAELCREFGISRTLGYRLLKRYEEEGYKGIAPYSRRPRESPQATSEELICAIVRIREQRRTWGGKTIRAKLARSYPEAELPSARTIDRILERCGLITKRRRRRTKYLPDRDVIQPKQVNDVWTADFKGWWRTKDGETCFPLTIRDEHSRFVLHIAAMHKTSTEQVKREFKRCFEEYGCPKYIRTDNGGPFAAIYGLQGLSKLSVWWIKNGILPNRIKPASPHLNGAHERMHRDMKADLQHSPARNLREEQLRFDEWRNYFNFERPHQALQMKTPSEKYTPSSRLYLENEPEFQYDDGFENRKVGCRGHIYWRSTRTFVSNALKGERIGILPEDENTLSVWYRDFFLGETNHEFSLPLGEGSVNSSRTENGREV